MAANILFHPDSLIISIIDKNIRPIRSILSGLNCDGVLPISIFQIIRSDNEAAHRLADEIMIIFVNGWARLLIAETFSTLNRIGMTVKYLKRAVPHGIATSRANGDSQENPKCESVHVHGTL
jgi:hypothetical protein